MELLMAMVVGFLYATGLFLMQRRNLVKFIIGLALLSHGANLLIFTAGGLTRGEPPLIPETDVLPPPLHADPLPQALILTAIVISFAVLAFALILFLRAYQTTGTDDLDDLRSTDT
jgi:multicomponent Na+:H+ antiporter subunit C